jgi:hypothetical protein
MVGVLLRTGSFGVGSYNYYITNVLNDYHRLDDLSLMSYEDIFKELSKLF